MQFFLRRSNKAITIACTAPDRFQGTMNPHFLHNNDQTRSKNNDASFINWKFIWKHRTLEFGMCEIKSFLFSQEPWQRYVIPWTIAYRVSFVTVIWINIIFLRACYKISKWKEISTKKFTEYEFCFCLIMCALRILCERSLRHLEVFYVIFRVIPFDCKEEPTAGV